MTKSAFDRSTPKGRGIVTAAVATALVASALTALAPTASASSASAKPTAPAGSAAKAAPARKAAPVPKAAPADVTAPDHLVISAVFGSDGGAYKSDWVQLYNPTSSPVSLGTISGSTVSPNYYQCYRSISGTSCNSTKLYGTVLPHHYFLIWDGHNAGNSGVPPTSATPDLNFALNSTNTAGTSTDPSGQSNTGFGGYATGGQILLLNATSNGAYTGTGDLASAAAKAGGVVDAVSWTKYAAPTYTQAGSAEGGAGNSASAGTSNLYVSARTFVNGVPQDTDNNAADFAATTTYSLTSQTSSRVAVAKIADTTIARNGAMTPIDVQGSNGVGTLGYAATGLPTGTSIDPGTGIISGTPTATAGSYPVTVTVSDQTPGSADTATTSFTLTVVDAVVVGAIADVTIHQGDALGPIQVQASGGTPPYSYAATGLPAGTAIDQSTGAISGTPTTGAGRRRVHVTVTDSGAGSAALSASTDVTVIELPATTAPSSGDPLAGLRINEVVASGTPAKDFVELYDTGADISGASVDLTDASGATYQLTGLTVAHDGFAVVNGSDLDAAGLDLAANDTLYLSEAGDATLLDQTSWTSFQTTSWARYPDGTGDFAVSKQATKGAPNAVPAAAATDHLVIAAVFGANADTVRWTNDWVELYNPTDTAVSLGSIDVTTSPATVTPSYDLCYRTYSATGACSSLVKLYGTVAPHHYFFVWYQNAHTPQDHGTYPAGFTPDLDVSVATPANGNQTGSNMGGCNTGGQIELLDTSKGTAPINGDLSTPAAKAAGEVDGLGWMNASTNQPAAAESAGSATVKGVDSGTNNTCVIARRFSNGFAVDTDANSTDFTPVTDINSFPAHSQASDRVAITPIADAEVSRNEQLSVPVQAKAVYGALNFSATGLPGGITIDPATGVISGTPSPSDDLAGYPVTVTVSDGAPSDTATATFTLTVSKGVRLDPVGDLTASKGAAITTLQLQAHGGASPYTYSAAGLPNGLTLNTTTGVISGTPTDALGSYLVHASVTDSAVGADQTTAAQDFTVVEVPPTAGPAPGDPLAGLRINEVKATGTPANDWIELYNTGPALSGVPLQIEDGEGDTYTAPAQDIAAHGFAVIDGPALAAAGFHLAKTDTLYLAEADDTLLDSTSWTAYEPTSWARTTDGTGAFDISAYATKGGPNSGAPVIKPNDLITTEVNYDNNSTDYYEYSEITNTTDHPIDFAVYGLTLTKSGVAMTLHDPSDTTSTSPTVDPVIPAHGTQLFWWVETQYFGVKTTAQFLANYGLPSSTPVVLVFGFTSLANSGGDHSFYLSVNKGSTVVSQSYVDTPCAANTLNGTSVCPATNGNYAEHYEVPADRTNPVAATWYNSLHSGGDDLNYVLKAPLSTPGTVDLEQVGFTRAVTIGSATTGAVTLHNTSAAAVDLSGYVLSKNAAGASYTLPGGTAVAAGADLVVAAGDSGLSFAGRDYVSLLAPRGYAYTDGIGLADTTGPILHTLAYDASSGQPPVIDPTTGLPLPPAGGLYRPAGVSASNGTVYASNTGDNLLAALANGSNTVIAGGLDRYGFDQSQDGGDASTSSLYQPGGTAVDAAGNIYIADSADNLVLEITRADSKIHVVAGTGASGGAGAVITGSSTGRSVNLYRPQAVAVDAGGNVYISDTYDNRVIEVAPSGTATLVAGTGKPGYTGDGSAATSARLSQPTGLAVDSQGNVYIADSADNVVRRIDAGTGVITTVAGDYAADLAQNSCLGGFSGDGGPATSAQLNDPQGVAVDGAGDLFIADTFNNAIREVTPDGTIGTVVNSAATAGAENTSPTGSGARPAATRLNTPYAVTIDGATDTLYLADTRNNQIAQVQNLAEPGAAAGPVEPADQVSQTGSGIAFAACDAMANPPQVAGLQPASGPRTGGTTVTVTGTHFTGSTAVTFGTTAATKVTVVNDTTLTALAPAHAVGQVDVTVTNAAGTSTAVPADEYTYLPILPVISGVSPDSGPRTGGTAVTVTGTHFTGATAVTFGGVAATDVTVVDDTTLRVVAPAHTPGPVDVTVTTGEGASAVVAADGYTYQPVVPAVTGVAPASGPAVGGTRVTVTGSNFTGNTGVRFGTAAGTRVVVVDDSHLSVTAPAHAPGRVDVTVSSQDGTSAVGSADRFTFATPPCTYVADYAALTRAQARLAADQRTLAAEKALLKKTRRASTRAALERKIAALGRTIAADRTVVAADQKLVNADAGHSWCTKQVAAQATLLRAQAKLATDLTTLSGLEARLRETRRPSTRAALKQRISALGKTIAADRKAVIAAEQALGAAT